MGLLGWHQLTVLEIEHAVEWLDQRAAASAGNGVARNSLGAAFRIPFHYELGRLKEDAGRLAEARQHYTAYLERWGNADVSIPNVDDARSRLAKLDTQM